MSKVNDLTGKRFGRLTVLEKAESRNGKTYWKCKCDCGKEKEVYSFALTSGHTNSCGCLKSETTSKRNIDSAEDLTGKKFGRLTVIKRNGYTNGKRKLPTWLCQCDCGEMATRTGKALKDTFNSGCDKCKYLYDDLTGRKFGSLTVISRHGSKNGDMFWNCKCKCGKTIQVSTGQFNSGHVISCGCLKRERIIERNTTHGMSNTRLYEIWGGMKKRCYNKHSKPYPNYGGRGITICDEWREDFQAFYDWAMANGYSDELSIDRIDNDKGYSPDNCRWATVKEQSLNKRETIYFELFGANKPLMEWCEFAQIEYSRAYQRYKNGNYPFDEEELKTIEFNFKGGNQNE